MLKKEGRFRKGGREEENRGRRVRKVKEGRKEGRKEGKGRKEQENKEEGEVKRE